MDPQRPRPALRRREGRDEEEEKKKSGDDDATFVDEAVASVAQLAPGARVSGYVKQVNKGGCFVALSRSVDARVKMCNLGDAFAADPRRRAFRRAPLSRASSSRWTPPPVGAN